MIDPYLSEVHGRYRHERLLREAEVARMLRAARAAQKAWGPRAQAPGGAPGWALVRRGLAAAGGVLITIGTWLQHAGLPPLGQTEVEPLATA